MIAPPSSLNPSPDTDPEARWYEGDYGSYIEDLKRRKGPDADQPHRVAYKKLVRA